jgi:hypothetical protein
MRSLLVKIAIPLSIIVLVLWSIGTFYFEAPGWFHGLLTGGIFLLLWGIVSRPQSVGKKTNRPRA